MGVDAKPCYLTLLKYVVEFLFSIDRIEMVQNEIDSIENSYSNTESERNNIINQSNYMICKFVPKC